MRGGIDPGKDRFRPRCVAISTLSKGFFSGDGSLSSPGEAGSRRCPDGHISLRAGSMGPSRSAARPGRVGGGFPVSCGGRLGGGGFQCGQHMPREGRDDRIKICRRAVDRRARPRSLRLHGRGGLPKGGREGEGKPNKTILGWRGRDVTHSSGSAAQNQGARRS